jgi:hypothetical protein
MWLSLQVSMQLLLLIFSLLSQPAQGILLKCQSDFILPLLRILQYPSISIRVNKC